MLWQWVINYEGHYQVGEDGRVKSIARPRVYNGTLSMSRERILTASRRSRLAPYLSVALTLNNVKKTCAVHTLVLNAFVGPCPEGMEGRHKDGDGANNALSNLEWNTPKRNGEDRIVHRTQVQGEQHHKNILTLEEVKEIRAFFSVPRAHGAKAEMARQYGIAHSTLSSVLHNKSWSNAQ